MEVVAVGGIWCDFVSISSRLPKRGETILGTKFITQHGGKAANVATTVSNLNGKSILIARIGDDYWGEKGLKSLNELGVNTKYVEKTSGHHTGIALVNLSENGENQIVGIPGANFQLTVEFVENHRDVIERAELVATTFEIPPESAKRVLELSRGVSILNAAPAVEDCEPSLFILPTIFLVNETEASVFTKIPISSLQDAKNAARNLLEKGCKSVIITMGEQGAVFASDILQDPVHVKCPSVTCLDSTGAGDAFTGVLAYLMVYRKDLEMEQMVEAACYCASYSVTIQGSQTSLPTETALKQFFLSKKGFNQMPRKLAE